MMDVETGMVLLLVRLLLFRLRERGFKAKLRVMWEAPQLFYKRNSIRFSVDSKLGRLHRSCCTYRYIFLGNCVGGNDINAISVE